MAEWGKGDPRWIVEDRPDATNVNNWHWSEKNATTWSKGRLQELFKNFEIEQGDFKCVVDAIDTNNGEASVNNRKGKLLFFYEWELELKWSGRLLNSQSQLWHKGKLGVPNLSEEHALHEINIIVSIDNSNDESEVIKEFMYNVGRERIRQQLGIYIQELKQEYSKNFLLPKKNEGCQAVANTNDILKNVTNIEKTAYKVTSNSLNATAKKEPDHITRCDGYKIDTRILCLSKEFQCDADQLYHTLTNEQHMHLFTRMAAKVNPVPGGEFVLYNGSVLGKFKLLVPGKQIVKFWRLKAWAPGHYSLITIDLEQTAPSCTTMQFMQVGIPASEFDAMPNTLEQIYWQGIQEAFGF